MDSKNLIWLGSFFSLLFITFCVTKHLDDLNPNIISIPHQPQEFSSELAAVDLEDVTQNTVAPNLETPNLETPNLETPNLETPNLETPNLETPRLVKETTELFSTEDMKIEVPKVAPIKVVKKPIIKKKPPVLKKAKKQKTGITETKNTKQKTNYGTPYTIGRINLNSDAMQGVFNHQNNNQLNKLAYMHSINKNSTITISTNDMKSANSLKRYFQNQNVQKQNIKIIRDAKNHLIKITLTGRK